MKYYLSSYKVGNETDKLLEITEGGNKKTAYIPNALDFSNDLERRKNNEKKDMDELSELGFTVNLFDLKKYFGDQSKLIEDIAKYDMIWVRGGNTFVLRQAMRISGFDKWLLRESKKDNALVYGGYSAGVCVLSPSLKGVDIVDDPKKLPYAEIQEAIYEGLGIIDWAFAPHYDSDHPESDDISKMIDYYIENQIPFKALRDGEVILID